MFPILKNKYIYQSITSASDYVKNYGIERLSKNAIITYPYSTNILIKVLKNIGYRFKKYGKFLVVENKITTCLCPISAPNAVCAVEEMRALGCMNFINIGIAGSLCDNLDIGDVIVCDKAIRDEGVSYHYIKPKKYSYPCHELTKDIEKKLSKNNIRFSKGASWTTDAPYRETKKEFLKYSKEGVITVDMEASSIFAVSEYYGLSSASVFVISDILSANGWYHEFDSKKIERSLAIIFSIFIKKYAR